MDWKIRLRKAGLDALFASGLHRAIGRRAGALGIILTLHHVRRPSDANFAPNAHLEVTPDFLDSVLAHVRARGFDIVSLSEVAARLADPDGAARPFAAFTLDDGYRDNAREAWPIFRRHRAPFAIFVATGFVDRKAVMWWRILEAAVGAQNEISVDLGSGGTVLDCAGPAEKQAAFARIAGDLSRAPQSVVTAFVADLERRYGLDGLAVTDRESMTWDELAELAADPLATIGGHTVSHPNLAALEPADALAEMQEGARVLEARLGRRPAFFAYPYGYPAAAGPREFALAAQAGFRLAVTTRPGLVFPEHDCHRLALPRVSLNGHFQALRHLDVLLSGAPFALANPFRRLDVA